MKHDVVLEGYGIRLRPVAMDDAEFIVKLRNMPHAVGKIGDSATTPKDQQTWLKKYFERDDDYYFIIESLSSSRLGTTAVYDIDKTLKTAETGRLVAMPGHQIAYRAGVIRSQFCFENLKLNSITSCVVSTNTQVIDLMQKLGYKIAYTRIADRIISSKYVNMTYFILSKQRWESIRFLLNEQALKICSKATL